MAERSGPRVASGAAAAAAVVAAVFASALHAAIVQMRDGRSFEGDIVLENGAIVVKSPGGTVRLDPAGLKVADFRALPAAPQRKSAPGAAPPGCGLRAEYFADPEFNEQQFVTIDPVVDFDWPSGLCGDPLIPETFSIRWTGHITPPVSGEYTLYVEADDGARLTVGGVVVIDRLRSPPGIHAGAFKMKAGQKYELRLEYRNARGPARCRLSWSGAGRAREIVPPENLSPPSRLIPPSARVASPRALSAHPGRQPIAIEAAVGDPDGQVRKVEFYVDGYLLGTVSREPWRLAWTDPAPGRHTVCVRAVDNSGLSTLSEPVAIEVAGESGPLPPPWSAAMIGRGLQGSVRSAPDGALILETRGGSMWSAEEWGRQDSFLFVHQQLPGDGVITVRLVGFDGKDGAAGIVVRENLRTERVTQAMVGYAPGTGVVFRRRENNWEDSKATGEKAEPPCWLRLARYGRQFTAWWSSDGRNWRSMGSRRITMRAGVCIGLGAAGGERDAVRAVFDNISITRGSPPMQTTTPGILLRSGSLLACQVHEMTDSGIKLFRHEHLVIYTSQVARVLFRPITVEQAEQIEPGRAGVLLANGDFFDGTFTGMKDGFVRVNSVLFGPRKFHSFNEVLAVVLRDPAPGNAPWEIALADGSLIRAKDLTISEGRCKAVDESGVNIVVLRSEILTIRAVE